MLRSRSSDQRISSYSNIYANIWLESESFVYLAIFLALFLLFILFIFSSFVLFVFLHVPMQIHLFSSLVPKYAEKE